MPERCVSRGTRRRSDASAMLACIGILLLACRAERPAAGTAAAAGGEGPMAAGASPMVPAGGSAPSAYFPNLTVEKNVPVPMRDGIVLRADIYRPETPGKYPTLVY